VRNGDQSAEREICIAHTTGGRGATRSEGDEKKVICSTAWAIVGLVGLFCITLRENMNFGGAQDGWDVTGARSVENVRWKEQSLRRGRAGSYLTSRRTPTKRKLPERPWGRIRDDFRKRGIHLEMGKTLATQGGRLPAFCRDLRG